MDSDLDVIRQDLDPEMIEVAEQAKRPVPPHWQGYLSAHKDVRLNALSAEMRDLARYFPEAAGQLARIAVDAFLLESPRHGLCRFIVVGMEGERSYRYSMCPLNHDRRSGNEITHLIRARAPAAMAHIYFEMMDGLTDIYDFVGFRNSLGLTTVENEIDTYAEIPAIEALQARGRLDDIVEIFGSGGGGYLLMDLNEDLRTHREPEVLRVFSDDGRLETSFPLFAMLDAWMAVGLGMETPEHLPEY